MQIKLLQYPSIENLVTAIRVCHDSISKSDSYNVELLENKCKYFMGNKDRVLIKSVIIKGHTSTLEHMVYTFWINGISRGCLQELVRHRLASYSVQSTRYTLQKLKDVPEDKFKDYLVQVGMKDIDDQNAWRLREVKAMVENPAPISNNNVKYLLPEAFKTKLVMTINARSLRNFFKLRLDKDAHWEIRELAENMLYAIPEEHKLLFE